MRDPDGSVNERARRDFWYHVVFLVLVGAYFCGLLVWFGGMLVRGGTEEHVVMSMVVPLVVLLALVALLGLSIIALEGRRAARYGDQPGDGGHSEPGTR